MSANIPNIRSALLWLSLPLAVAIIVSTAILARSLETIKGPKKSIEIKGFAEKKIHSDMAVWHCDFSATAMTLPLAYEKIQKDAAQVIKYLLDNGIKKEEIFPLPLATMIIYKKNEKGNDTTSIEKYTLRLSYKIVSKDVRLVEKLSFSISELIKYDIEIGADSPAYYYTKMDSIKIEILGEATKNARQRAERIAENCNCSIGNLIWAKQGVLQITPPFSNEVSDGGQNDSSSIEKSVKSVVTAEFFVNDKQENNKVNINNKTPEKVNQDNTKKN